MYKHITDPQIAYELLRADALMWRSVLDDRYFPAYRGAWECYSPDNFPVNHAGGTFYIRLEE